MTPSPYSSGSVGFKQIGIRRNQLSGGVDAELEERPRTIEDNALGGFSIGICDEGPAGKERDGAPAGRVVLSGHSETAVATAGMRSFIHTGKTV